MSAVGRLYQTGLKILTGCFGLFWVLPPIILAGFFMEIIDGFFADTLLKAA
jgi:hypothetical protein